MTRRRFIADEVNADGAALTGSHAEHLSRVLRARIGQEFDIATGEQVRRARVITVSDERVEFELGEPVETAFVRPVTMALAVFKFDRFEWAVEKCTELGVSRIVPVIARRTDAHLAHAAEKRVDRWRRIAREASEQSRRIATPGISEPTKLKAYLASEQSKSRILLAESEEEVQLRDLCSGSEEIALAIGPEGGWTEEELKSFSTAGWQSASLGRTILRAETAAIAALAIVQALSD
jgi:16S rRNA (uracil1498-N3)-methyltransferase